MEQKVDRDQVRQHPRYALFSVADKTGIENLARGVSDFGFEILSSGGTAKALMEAGIPFTEVSELTRHPNLLDGAIKSFHPEVIGGIVAQDLQRHFNELLSLKTSFIDIVICNMGPFSTDGTISSAPLPELLGKIDIGGPTLLKAAAKNFQRVVVICDPKRYHDLLWYLASDGEVPVDIKFEWAKSAFEHVVAYDSTVYAALLEYETTTK